MQVNGGGGVSDDGPLASMYAPMRTLRLADGPDEVHKLTIRRGGPRAHAPARRSEMPEPAPRGRNPYDTSGVERGADGVARYRGRPDSLVHMLRATVERHPDGLAVAEIGGGQVTYRELWERAARVAGGLRAEGVERGDRVALRLPNGLDWVLAFWGSQLAGAVVVPVNTRFKDAEAQYVIDDSGASFVFGALPEGDPVAVDDLGPDDL